MGGSGGFLLFGFGGFLLFCFGFFKKNCLSVTETECLIGNLPTLIYPIAGILLPA